MRERVREKKERERGTTNHCDKYCRNGGSYSNQLQQQNPPNENHWISCLQSIRRVGAHAYMYTQHIIIDIIITYQVSVDSSVPNGPAVLLASFSLSKI